MLAETLSQYPYDRPIEAFPFEIFKQAFVAVQSCVVHLQKVSLARRFALVLLGPPLLSYGSRCKVMLTAVDDAVQLVVDRPYKTGDPIYVWCGPQPNLKLLINYGFVDDDNPYDRIMIESLEWRCVNAGKVSSTDGSTNTFVQDLENKKRQNLVDKVEAKMSKKVEEEVDAKVNKKLEDILKRLSESNPGITVDIEALCGAKES